MCPCMHGLCLPHGVWIGVGAHVYISCMGCDCMCGYRCVRMCMCMYVCTHAVCAQCVSVCTCEITRHHRAYATHTRAND